MHVCGIDRIRSLVVAVTNNLIKGKDSELELARYRFFVRSDDVIPVTYFAGNASFRLSHIPRR